MSTACSRRKLLSRLGAVGLLPFVAACGAAPRPENAPSAGLAKTALLVPLSGPQADLGQTMAKAVWFAEDRRGLLQRAAVFDTGPSPEGAVAAAKQAQAAGADIIVGPLFSNHTAAVLKSGPEPYVITLSNNDQLAAAGAWVFGVTPAQSAGAAARFAAKSGAKTITLRPPPGAFGARSTAALVKAAKASGLTALPPLPAEGSDRALDALLSSNAGQAPDSLYLPAADRRSRSLAKQASAAGIEVIGSVQWADVPAAALKMAGDVRFVGPDPVLFENLSASYRNALGEEMGIISGLAVDAVLLANRLPRARSGQIQMTGGAPMKGLLGPCAFRKDRTCARELAVLQLKDGRVMKVA
ncbi:penicillin-binding protein activator [uncultured Roseobacter sp.]|uniref:penicillin-binding protein activator n=1 Tax=uncultured Roseobacter sp. TaxID=114847 RepID=UPI002613ECE3|nr:penicillin-binding protein activator [uncultured Roseobacter sp.]